MGSLAQLVTVLLMMGNQWLSSNTGDPIRTFTIMKVLPKQTIKMEKVEMGIYSLMNDRFFFTVKAVSTVDAEMKFIAKHGMKEGYPRVTQVIEL
jgi:hypothetical protein